MSAAAEYAWDIRRIFVERRLPTSIHRKSGKTINKVKVPVTVCRLFLTGDFITTHSFRCIPVFRSGVVSCSVSALSELQKPLWPMPVLRPDPKAGPAWKKWATFTPAEFTDWLAKLLGPERALEALREPRVGSFFCSISSLSDLKSSPSLVFPRSKKRQRRRMQPVPAACVPNNLAQEAQRRPFDSARGTASRSPPGAAGKAGDQDPAARIGRPTTATSSPAILPADRQTTRTFGKAPPSVR